jgi:hypothetical protein
MVQRVDQLVVIRGLEEVREDSITACLRAMLSFCSAGYAGTKLPVLAYVLTS